MCRRLALAWRGTRSMKVVFVSVSVVTAVLAFSVGTATGGRVPFSAMRSAESPVPVKKTPRRPKVRAPKPGEHAPYGPIGSRGIAVSALNEVIQNYCTDCHNEQVMSGNLSLEKYDIDTASKRLAVSEKMIRKLRAQMMPLPGAPRPGGDTLTALVETIEQVIDKTSQAESRRPHVPAAQSPGVRERDQGSARHRRERRRLSAARHEERELRQHRRRAGAVADAARGVSERRVRGEPHGRRRSHRDGDHGDVQRVAIHVAASVGSRSRARRTARAAASSRRTTSRRTVSISSAQHLGRHRHEARGPRHLDRRSARRAAALRDAASIRIWRRPTRRRARTTSAASRFRSRAGQHKVVASRSCAASKVRTKI